MNKEQKRKLRNISLLALVGLIGGTFAFTAFNQQVINDQDGENQIHIGGRVHDYFDRETGNKDVFVENFGQQPIMARIRLSEYMEIQKRGERTFTPVVEGTSRGNTEGWSPYIPAGDNLNTRTGAGADRFNQYSNLTFGWTRGRQVAPWYLQTFNTVYNESDNRIAHFTAAAGDARDYVDQGATHPGDGTDNYWSENDSHDNSAGEWPGAMVTRNTIQNLPQDRAPMTLQTWSALVNDADKVGNFWVIDHETGWAYWANQLNGGQATSYLLDAVQMTIEDSINGAYYYAIHVTSDLISLDQEFRGEPDTGAVTDLLEEIRTSPNATGNPRATTVAPASTFDFSRMRDTSGANTRFTIDTPAGPQEFRYLERMEDGNHLIIRNEAIRSISFANQESELTRWFRDDLPTNLKTRVAPVARSFETGEVSVNQINFTAGTWAVSNFSDFPEVVADRTEVVSIEDGGVPRAFALSLADVQHLSVEISSRGFMNTADRGGANESWWWTRTLESSSRAWRIRTGGMFDAPTHSHEYIFGGVRPALIIRQ